MLDLWLQNNLVCPLDKTPLKFDGVSLLSASGRSYPVIDGIPVLLVADAKHTHGAGGATLTLARSIAAGNAISDGCYWESIGVTEREKDIARAMLAGGHQGIDPIIQILVGATNGIAYKNVIGKLKRVPVPTLPIVVSIRCAGAMLDVGCSWGRWSVALAESGAEIVVGIDPSIGAVAAANRLCKSRGLKFIGVVADARYLPFSDGTFAGALSYSVLQHFSRDDAHKSIDELHRTVKDKGQVSVQMPNRLGIRCAWHLAKRRFSDGEAFEVRYWSLAQLKKAFSKIGPTTISIDCFFGLGLQLADIDLMPRIPKIATLVSELLKTTLGDVRLGTLFADSVWCTATKVA